LIENAQIAHDERVPICQDTGMAVIFIEVGQDVHVVGGLLNEALNEGVRRGYVKGYLRKSVVRDPFERVNTRDNTPAVIHYDIVPGNNIYITVVPKGFGGTTTALAVNLEVYPTQIPSMPVAVNISCHATRHKEARLEGRNV